MKKSLNRNSKKTTLKSIKSLKQRSKSKVNATSSVHRRKPHTPATFIVKMDNREERLEIRLTLPEKSKIEKAAILSDTNVTTLTRKILLDASNLIIADKEGLFTTEESRKHFFDTLDNPPPVPHAAKQAYKFYLDNTISEAHGKN